MGGLSWWHWMIIIAAFVILFGYKRLPDAARGVGRSLRILKSEVSAMADDDKAKQPAENDATAAVATPAPQITPSPVVPVVPVTPPPPVSTSVPVEERKN